MGSQQPVSQLQATKAFGEILSTIQGSVKANWAPEPNCPGPDKAKANAMCVAGIKYMQPFLFQVNSWLRGGTTRNRPSSGKPLLTFSPFLSFSFIFSQFLSLSLKHSSFGCSLNNVQAHPTRPRKGKEERLKAKELELLRRYVYLCVSSVK